MKKFERAFKLKVAEDSLPGEGGAKQLARAWDTPEEKSQLVEPLSSAPHRSFALRS